MHCAETTRTPRAQPCSYIYPIYSVVKYPMRSAIPQSRCTLECRTYSLASLSKDQPNAVALTSTSGRTVSYFRNVVELNGIEPLTPLLAKQVLSQLS